MLVLECRVRAGVTVKVRATVRDSCRTKRLGTKRLGYEMFESRKKSSRCVCRLPR